MLQAPVLQLDVAKMCEIDPRNVENLYGMWAVFSRCSSSIAEGNGKRLENLSWRVWARETLCCPPQPKRTIVPTITSPLPSNDDVPSLSNSLGSASDLDSLQSFPENSALSKSRGREIHITPRMLGRIITNIHEQKSEEVEPLDPEVQAIVSTKMSPNTRVLLHRASPASHHSPQVSPGNGVQSSILSSVTTNASTVEGDSLRPGSETSVSSDGLIRSGSIVHGFSPRASIRSRGDSITSKKGLSTSPMLVSKLSPAKKKGMFMLGGSSEDDESSFETMMSWRNKISEPKKSSLSRGISDVEGHKKKTTSFRDVVEQHTIQHGNDNVDDNAIASDEDDDDDDSAIDDSAIEEDDDEGWEDEQPEEEKPAPQPLFKRVDSSAHLPSRRSVLTQGLTEGDRAEGMLRAATRSTSALHRMGRSSSTHPAGAQGNSPEEDGIMMRTIGRGIAVPQPSNEQAYAMAHSPRTTRRHMLSTELTESLRKNLLWERRQKNTTVNAFLKREARSMANLQQAGQSSASRPPARDSLAPAQDTSNDDYFNPVNEYHAKGW